MHARDIMTQNPQVVTPNDPVERAAAIMRDRNVGAVPVVDDRTHRHLVGVLTDRDIVIRCVAPKHGAGCTVSDHMTHDRLDTVLPDDDVSKVLGLMERDQVRRIPVVDADNRLEGIIAQADIATKLGPSQPLKVEGLLERVSAGEVPAMSA